MGTTSSTARGSVTTGDQRETPASFTPGWEYFEPEYLSHDAPGYTCLLSAGGILATDEEGGVEWIVEGEIDPKHGCLIAAAPELYEALKIARECIAYCRRNHKDAQSGEGFPVEMIIDAALAKATVSDHQRDASEQTAVVVP